MEEMINLLTRGIGAELYKPLRISYYNKKRFLEKNDKFQKSSKRNKQFIIDVMALSIFNQKIILPYHGAANFAAGSKAYGVTRVRMASYHLDKEFYVAAKKITSQFYAITYNYGLRVEHLHISSISEFVDHCLEVVKTNGN